MIMGIVQDLGVQWHFGDVWSHTWQGLLRLEGPL